RSSSATRIRAPGGDRLPQPRPWHRSATLAPGTIAGVWPSASLDKEDRALAEDSHLVACGAPPARPATRPDLVRPHDDQVHPLSQRRPDDFRCRLAAAYRGAHVDPPVGELPGDLPQRPLRAFHEAPVEGIELPGR